MYSRSTEYTDYMNAYIRTHTQRELTAERSGAAATVTGEDEAASPPYQNRREPPLKKTTARSVRRLATEPKPMNEHGQPSPGRIATSRRHQTGAPPPDPLADNHETCACRRSRLPPAAPIQAPGDFTASAGARASGAGEKTRDKKPQQDRRHRLAGPAQAPNNLRSLTGATAGTGIRGGGWNSTHRHHRRRHEAPGRHTHT